MRGSVSRTAQGVAVVRAGFQDRPHTADGDPDAQMRLARWMRAGRAPLLRDHLHARTIFFDTCVLDAVERGIPQVVILGAGFDDRALRFRSPGVRFFELDHPATQGKKRRRVKRLREDTRGLVFVAADFARDDVGDLLEAAGHDVVLPTLFVCEGLLVYLDESEIVDLLGALVARAAPGSELAVSIAVHKDGLPSAEVVRVANSRRGRSGQREPWRTILPAADHLALLDRAGWGERETTDDSELWPAAPPGRSLLVRASLTVGR